MRISALWALAAGLGLLACAASQTEEGTTASADLSAEDRAVKRTLEELASFGEKRVGTPEGARAAGYVADRMRRAGLQQVHDEPFQFPMHVADVPGSSLSVTIAGASRLVPFDVFEGSGAGKVDGGDLVWVGSAKPDDLRGKDLRGKIAFVERDSRYHRSSQARNVAQAGAVAMLYASTAPENQIQIGSVREKWEALIAIPTVTIGADDGKVLKCALGERKPSPSAGRDQDTEPPCPKRAVKASLEVKAHATHGTGKNVVGIVPGRNYGKRDAQGVSLDHQIVIGAHFDTWYVGSVDNGGGVAAMLGIAEARARLTPEYTEVYVGYDGEEVGLYGGYDYLRRHQDEGLVTVINLESPSTETDLLAGGFETLLTGIAKSEIPSIDDAIDDETGPFKTFFISPSLDYIANMFGGIIPTDIQGMYRSGIPTLSTASSSPWYHTRYDTPDKVDVAYISRVTRSLGKTIDRLQRTPLESFRFRDAKLWAADLVVNPDKTVATTLYDNTNKLLPNTPVTATLFCDDFFAEPDVTASTDAQGQVRFDFRSKLASCMGRRWVHVTAGPSYPLVEKVRALP